MNYVVYIIGGIVAGYLWKRNRVLAMIVVFAALGIGLATGDLVIPGMEW